MVGSDFEGLYGIHVSKFASCEGGDGHRLLWKYEWPIPMQPFRGSFAEACDLAADLCTRYRDHIFQEFRVDAAPAAKEVWVNVYEHDGEYAATAYRSREAALAEESYNVLARAVRCVWGAESDRRCSR